MCNYENNKRVVLSKQITLPNLEIPHPQTVFLLALFNRLPFCLTRRSPPRRSPPRRWAEEPPQSRGYTAPAPPPPMLRDSSEFQTIVSASTNRPDQVYKASEQKKLEERQNIPLEDIGFREKLNYLNKNEGNLLIR